MDNLCVKWDAQSSAFLQSISKIHLQERFSDATVICQGKYFSVHRIVLSSCSVYFEEIFEKINSQHPVIVFTDIEPQKMELLLSFMYQGEAEVEQEHFLSFMKAGEALKIKGISVDDVYTCENAFFSNKKRKVTKGDTLHSKRKSKSLKSHYKESSLPLPSGAKDGANHEFVYSSGNIPDKEVVKTEPYFDFGEDSSSKVLNENSENLTNFEAFDNPDKSHNSSNFKIGQTVERNDEKFYFMDDIPEEGADGGSEAHPSVSNENRTINNTQEKFGKKKISAQKGKRSSKLLPTSAIMETQNIIDDLQYHIPTEGKSRRRCSSCAKKGKEKRTKIYCAACHLPFCNDCFTLCHIQMHFKSLWE